MYFSLVLREQEEKETKYFAPQNALFALIVAKSLKNVPSKRIRLKTNPTANHVLKNFWDILEMLKCMALCLRKYEKRGNIFQKTNKSKQNNP